MANSSGQSNEPDTLLKVSEVAVTFGVTPYTIREWIRDGKLKGVKIGKGHYWRVSSNSVKKLAQELYGDK